MIVTLKSKLLKSCCLCEAERRVYSDMSILKLNLVHQLFCFANELTQHPFTKNIDGLIITDDTILDNNRKTANFKKKYTNFVVEKI